MALTFASSSSLSTVASYHSQQIPISLHSSFKPLLKLHIKARPSLSTTTCRRSTLTVRDCSIFEWAEKLLRMITRAPMRLLIKEIESDLDKATEFVKAGASVVKEVAEEIDEFAERVEATAEQVEAIAEKVEKTTERIEKEVDEVLHTLEDEKKVLVKIAEKTEISTSTNTKEVDS